MTGPAVGAIPQRGLRVPAGTAVVTKLWMGGI